MTNSHSIPKVCNTCNKTTANFIAPGHSKCRDCINLYVKARSRTKAGLIERIFHAQRNSSEKRGHSAPEYTKEQLIDWALAQDKYHELHDAWVASGYHKWFTPSFDRKEDAIGYSFINIEITTWKQNYDKSREDIRSGKLIRKGKFKPVTQFTLDGVFVAHHESQTAAAKAVGKPKGSSSIYKCCRGERSEAYGYRWISKS